MKAIDFNSVIALVGIEATCWQFKNSDIYWRILANWQVHLQQFHENPQHWKGHAMLCQSCDLPQLRGSTHLCKLKKQPEQWRALTTERNISLYKDKLSVYPIYHLLMEYFIFVLVGYFYDFFPKIMVVSD